MRRKATNNHIFIAMQVSNALFDKKKKKINKKSNGLIYEDVYKNNIEKTIALYIYDKDLFVCHI